MQRLFVGHVEQSGVRRERGGLLVLAALEARADVLDLLPLRRRLLGDSRSGVRSSRSTPVDQFIGTYGFARSTSPVARSIVYAKPLRSKCTSTLRVRPADRKVDENVLVDGVVVPQVVRRGLEGPDHLAGVGVARDDRRAPLVVARPLAAVPRSGVRRAVIDEVELGIVREPSPDRGAAAASTLSPGQLVAPWFGAVSLRVERLEARADLDVRVGPDVVRAPELLARSRASSAAIQPRTPISPPLEPTMTLSFTTIGAIVIVSPRARSPIFVRQSRLPRRRVDRDGVAVEQVVEDLAVGEGGAAIHDVAAGEADRRLRVLGRAFHLSGCPACVRSSAYDTFGYGVTMYIVLPHDERRALVTAQHAGGEGPRGVQILRVGGR